MAIRDRTYRTMDDGERIEGTWRHVFIKNGPTYFLTDLKIYADGLIDCWGLVDIDGFRKKVASGWVATTLADGGIASAHHLGRWRMVDPSCITADDLVAEVEDTLAELVGGPTRSQLLDAALDQFLVDRTETNRILVRNAYHAIPRHLRVYVLSDQDAKDEPVRVLIGEIGEPLFAGVPGLEEVLITEERRREAIEYLSARSTRMSERRARPTGDDPDGPSPALSPASVGAGGTRLAKEGGWVDMAGDGFLSIDTPTPVEFQGVTYPSVTHAYWSLSTSDPATSEAIRRSPRPFEASKLGAEAPRTPGWHEIRLAVMTSLLRAKFAQHPDLADRLLATGDARIQSPYTFNGSFWSSGAHGRNWVGRILEIIRSEIRMDRATATD